MGSQWTPLFKWDIRQQGQKASTRGHTPACYKVLEATVQAGIEKPVIITSGRKSQVSNKITWLHYQIFGIRKKEKYFRMGAEMELKLYCQLKRYYAKY